MSSIEDAVNKVIAVEERQQWLDFYEMLNDEGKQELLTLLETQAKQ